MTDSHARPTVTIVLVTMNAAAFVAESLRSIAAQTYAADRITTVIVDHASTDGTQALIAQQFSWVNLIAEKANHGFAGGNNIGMQRYPADYYALLNPDAWIAPDWLDVLIGVLESDPQIGVVGSKIFYGDSQMIQHAGGMFRPNALTYHVGDHEPDSGQYQIRRDVDYVMGAAFVARGDLMRQLDYLPEDYFPAYYEEADFCMHVRKLGKRVVYVPEAVAWHDERFSGSRAFTARFLRRYHKHRYLFALRNFKTAEERSRFRDAERAWKKEYASSILGRGLLWYSKIVNWRYLIRNPWLISV